MEYETVTKIVGSFFERYNSNGVSGVSMLREEYEKVFERVERCIQEELRGITPADERRFGLSPEFVKLAMTKIVEDIFRERKD